MPPKLLKISVTNSVTSFARSAQMGRARLTGRSTSPLRPERVTRFVSGKTDKVLQPKSLKKHPLYSDLHSGKPLLSHHSTQVNSGYSLFSNNSSVTPILLVGPDYLQVPTPIPTIIIGASFVLNSPLIQPNYAPIQFRGIAGGNSQVKSDSVSRSKSVKTHRQVSIASKSKSLPSDSTSFRPEGVVYRVKQAVARVLGRVDENHEGASLSEALDLNALAEHRIAIKSLEAKDSTRSKDSIHNQEIELHSDVNALSKTQSDKTTVDITSPVIVPVPAALESRTVIGKASQQIAGTTTQPEHQGVQGDFQSGKTNQSPSQSNVLSITHRLPLSPDPVAFLQQRLEIVTKRNAANGQVIEKIARQLEVLKDHLIKMGVNPASLKDITRLLNRAQLTQKLSIHQAQTLVGDLNAEIFRMHSKIATRLASPQLTGQVAAKVNHQELGAFEKWWAGYYSLSRRIRRKLELFAKRAEKLLAQVSLSEMLSGDDHDGQRHPAEPLPEVEVKEKTDEKFFRSTSEKGPVYKSLYDAGDTLAEIRHGKSRH